MGFRRPTRAQALWMVGLGASSYGFVSPVLKTAMGYGYSVEGVTVAQYFVALLFWFFALSAARKSRKPDSGEWLRLALLGIFGSGGTTVLYYHSLAELPASLAIVLLFQFTWMTMLLETWIDRVKWTPRRIQALLMILAGTVLAVGILRDQWERGVSWRGVCLGLGSALTYSLLLYGTGRVAVDVSPVYRSFAISAGAGMPILLASPPEAFVAALSGWGIYGWGTLVALLAQIIPPLLFSVAIPVVGGGAAAVLGSLELPTAVVAAAVILGEPVGWDRWAGVFLILLGIVWSEGGLFVWGRGEQPGRR
ncbi:MAG: DMT family transporter [Alicyclobacillaceae bacterium]|nr:DMT family transporter [Alicyclobacillaceae bacterium]